MTEIGLRTERPRPRSGPIRFVPRRRHGPEETASTWATQLVDPRLCVADVASSRAFGGELGLYEQIGEHRMGEIRR
jgi:hypothetical protein